MNLFLQIQSKENQSDPTGAFIFIGIIFVAVLIWWTVSANREYSDAKDEFRRNPANRKNRQRLIEVAKSRRDDGVAALEVVELLEAANDLEKRAQNPKSKFVEELKSLSDLHEKGSLNDEEFEQAKAKLLHS